MFNSKNKLPAGYIFQTTSWENDADNYSTQSITGLTLEEVEFFKTIAPLFKDKYNFDRTGKNFHPLITKSFGNDDFDEEFFDIIKEISETIEGGDVLYDKWFGDVDSSDAVHESVGTPCQYDWGFVRVLESYKVLHNPVDIELLQVEKKYQ